MCWFYVFSAIFGIDLLIIGFASFFFAMLEHDGWARLFRGDNFFRKTDLFMSNLNSK